MCRSRPNDTLSAMKTRRSRALATNDTPSGDGGNVWAVATGPANGTVTGTNGSFSYTPNAKSANGSGYSFTYTITDVMATFDSPPRRSTSRRGRWTVGENDALS